MNVAYQLFIPCIVPCFSQEEAILSRWELNVENEINVLNLKLSSGANVIMVSSGDNVIIWCYHVMLSSGMIAPPFFVFPENFTHSVQIQAMY